MSVRSLVLMLSLCCLSPSVSAQSSADAGPSQVRIEQQDGRYRLLVDGKPFHVKGAGLASGSQEELAARGGNSFRTWSTGTDHVKVRGMLDRAQRNGLKVAMGIEVATSATASTTTMTRRSPASCSASVPKCSSTKTIPPC